MCMLYIHIIYKHIYKFKVNILHINIYLSACTCVCITIITYLTYKYFKFKCVLPTHCHSQLLTNPGTAEAGRGQTGLLVCVIGGCKKCFVCIGH